jgi:hypothetical protein
VAGGIMELASLDKSQLWDMGERGRDYYAKHLSLESGVDKFSQIFECI